MDDELNTHYVGIVQKHWMDFFLEHRIKEDTPRALSFNAPYPHEGKGASTNPHVLTYWKDFEFYTTVSLLADAGIERNIKKDEVLTIETLDGNLDVLMDEIKDEESFKEAMRELGWENGKKV
jgi:hypothetical protein